mmetsp:Transcript_21429/g.49597  ORF Transcript_21429/g.49597 Transcript_21429/m.49597 type:complete len:111 (+) Transcript_21429:62-394(+)
MSTAKKITGGKLVKYVKAMHKDISLPIEEWVDKKIQGDLAKIAKFLADLQPGEDKGKPIPQQKLCVMLKLTPSATKCSWQLLLEAVEANLDPHVDTAESVLAILKEQDTS